MTLRQKFLKLGWPARVAVFAVSICICALSADAYADDPKAAAEALRDSPPIRTSAQAPAKFFTINSVLAKMDRAQGRGKDAIRLVSLKSSNTVTDARPPLAEVSARGTEPFGLFTFRAPEGLLSRKWRGLQSDLIKEEKVLERCNNATAVALGISEVELLAKFSSELGSGGMDPWPAEARKYALESRNSEYSAPQQAHARARLGESVKI